MLSLLVTSLFLRAQEALPTPTSQSIPSGCDSILKQKAPRVSGGRLLHKVAPKYPKAARRAQLQGTVRLSATIAKDGNVKDVTVLEGDPALAAAATEAVQSWRYEPYRVNDVAVDVSQTISVNFKLDGRVEFSQDIASPEPSNGAPANGQPATATVADSALPYPVYKVGGDVKPPKGIYMPDPSYSKNARKAKIQGTVSLGLLINPAGEVGDVEVCKNLEPSLDQQAVETVRGWKFTPATKDGQPVAVHVRVEVTFRLY
jgi:TonB family protein